MSRLIKSPEAHQKFVVYEPKSDRPVELRNRTRRKLTRRPFAIEFKNWAAELSPAKSGQSPSQRMRKAGLDNLYFSSRPSTSTPRPQPTRKQRPDNIQAKSGGTNMAVKSNEVVIIQEKMVANPSLESKVESLGEMKKTLSSSTSEKALKRKVESQHVQLQSDANHGMFVYEPNRDEPAEYLKPSKRKFIRRTFNIPRKNFAVDMQPTKVVKSKKGSGHVEFYQSPEPQVIGEISLAQMVQDSPIPVVITSPLPRLVTGDGDEEEDGQGEEAGEDSAGKDVDKDRHREEEYYIPSTQESSQREVLDEDDQCIPESQAANSTADNDAEIECDKEDERPASSTEAQRGSQISTKTDVLKQRRSRSNSTVIGGSLTHSMVQESLVDCEPAVQASLTTPSQNTHTTPTTRRQLMESPEPGSKLTPSHRIRSVSPSNQTPTSRRRQQMESSGLLTQVTPFLETSDIKQKKGRATPQGSARRQRQSFQTPLMNSKQISNRKRKLNPVDQNTNTRKSPRLANQQNQSTIHNYFGFSFNEGDQGDTGEPVTTRGRRLTLDQNEKGRGVLRKRSKTPTSPNIKPAEKRRSLRKLQSPVADLENVQSVADRRKSHDRSKTPAMFGKRPSLAYMATPNPTPSMFVITPKSGPAHRVQKKATVTRPAPPLRLHLPGSQEVRMWQGGDGKRRKLSDMTELDIILDCVEETVWEYKQKMDPGPCKKAVNMFAREMQQTLRNTIMVSQKINNLKSSVSLCKGAVRRQRRELLNLQKEYTELQGRMAVLKKQSGDSAAHHRANQIQDISNFLKNIKELQTVLI